MSIFDVDSFISIPVEGALDTVVTPVPEGEYPAIIEDLKIRELTSKKTNLPIYQASITWDIVDDELRKQLSREKVTVRQDIWLDITDAGTLDMGTGKNVSLGRVRAAVGQNNPSVPWTMRHLTGAGPAKIKVGHRADQNNPEIKYAEVKAVGMLTA